MATANTRSIKRNAAATAAAAAADAAKPGSNRAGLMDATWQELDAALLAEKSGRFAMVDFGINTIAKAAKDGAWDESELLGLVKREHQRRHEINKPHLPYRPISEKSADQYKRQWNRYYRMGTLAKGFANMAVVRAELEKVKAGRATSNANKMLTVAIDKASKGEIITPEQCHAALVEDEKPLAEVLRKLAQTCTSTANKHVEMRKAGDPMAYPLAIVQAYRTLASLAINEADIREQPAAEAAE